MITKTLRCRYFIRTCKNKKHIFSLVPWLHNPICNFDECKIREFADEEIESKCDSNNSCKDCNETQCDLRSYE